MGLTQYFLDSQSQRIGLTTSARKTNVVSTSEGHAEAGVTVLLILPWSSNFSPPDNLREVWQSAGYCQMQADVLIQVDLMRFMTSL
jgi:hypothetical protein